MVTKSKEIKLAPNVIIMKRSEDQLVVIHPSNNDNFFQINGEIACQSFDLLSKGKTQDQIIKKLAKNFSDAPLKQLELDLNKFINELMLLKIVL